MRAGMGVLVFLAMMLGACGTVAVPVAQQSSSPAPVENGGKGQPLGPLDFPPAAESLSLSGAVAANVSVGRPTSCGWGSGSSGPPIYSFGLYFQVDNSWVQFAATTDGSRAAYTGPGTYAARAWLSQSPMTGQQPEYQGEIMLKVISDARPAVQRGALSGQLQNDSGRVTEITGSWTCE